MPDRQPDVGVYQELPTSEMIIAEMQRVAPPGMDELDDVTHQALRGLTRRLIAINPLGCRDEFDRYTDTSTRGLDLPEDALRQQHEGKTVVVTGGTGLVGSVLMRQITEFAPARLLSISRGTIEPSKPVSDADYIYVDIRNRYGLDAVVEAVKPDIIYHVAADKYNHLAESRVAHTLTTNVLGTQNVLDAARRYDVHQVVYASTGKASRPFSPDIYAASKKTGEWLMSSAAAEGSLLCSAGRFTHVVDDSYFSKKLQGWVENGEPIRLHGPHTYFYAQSALESAQLLMNAGLEAKQGELRVQAINNLGLPIGLVDMALGVIAKNNSSVPLYFYGHQEGYEDTPWPGLYDRLTAGDTSPLINALEAPEVVTSDTCPMIDAFPLAFKASPSAEAILQRLREASITGISGDPLRSIMHELSWELLDARLLQLPENVLLRAAFGVAQRAKDGEIADVHSGVDRAILGALHLVRNSGSSKA